MRGVARGEGKKGAMGSGMRCAWFRSRLGVVMLLLALLVSVGWCEPHCVAADTPNATAIPAATPPPTAAPDMMATMMPTAMPAPPAAPLPGVPVRLRIPRIGVDAAIESVGMTPDGAMDIPADYRDAAWFQPGPRPGSPGNAVIDGHVDWITSVAVFWKLRDLTAGDEIRVLGDDGIERRFVVTGWETYATTDVPMQRIFGPASGAHLNLITCDSNSHFDRSTAEYGGNLVVYADAAP